MITGTSASLCCGQLAIHAPRQCIRAQRRAAGELGANQVVLQACDQTGNAHDMPLAVGDRVRLFARTNAARADRGRGILGNNGSVLEVRAIAAAGVTLRNAGGREGLVAWDTLRDQGSGRIRLAYGDVLTIDATQGLTSTEHIEAMPAGTAAVNAYKAYTAASRHRRATFLAVAEGAERREIAGRRPLGDLRPIREADVWVNMARNLSRQPEQEGALAFLERAHAARQSATAALQTGLQPAEQRQAEGLAPTTLAAHLQRRRVATQLAVVAERLGAWIGEQAAALGELARLGPAVQDVAAQAMERLRPAMEQAAGRIRQRPERIAARRREAEVAAVRGELLEGRMRRFQADQHRGWTMVDAGMQRGFDEEARTEQARYKQDLAALDEKELRSAVRFERAAQQHRIRREQKAAARMKGPSPGM